MLVPPVLAAANRNEPDATDCYLAPGCCPIPAALPPSTRLIPCEVEIFLGGRRGPWIGSVPPVRRDRPWDSAGHRDV